MTRRPERPMIEQRRRDAIELKLAGIDNITIGKKLAADPAINIDGVAYPYGYGRKLYEAGEPPPSDKQIGMLVCRDIGEALQRRRDATEHAAEHLRSLEAERLDRVLAAIWRDATRGNLSAIDRVLKIMERRAKIEGLDSTTHRLTGEDGGAVEVSVESLSDRIRALAQDG